VRQSVGDLNCCSPSGAVSDAQNAMFRSTHAAAAAVAAAAACANEKAVSGSISSDDEHPEFFVLHSFWPFL